jgi:glycosyltransferase involved in cell wall biosynthesis
MPLRIVMITQAVDEDDPVLGFTCGWINALARLVERLEVICLRGGKHNLAGNVAVNVMPVGKFRRFFYLRNFLKKALREKSIDAVFAHMCPIYAWTASIAMKGKIPLGLWYAHPAATFILKLAAKSSDIIFTSAKGGFPFSSDKIVITGQGIDTANFAPVPAEKKEGSVRIISVGRISPIKRYEISLLAVKMVRDKLPSRNISYEIYGPLVTEESKAYSNNLLAKANEYSMSDVFKLHGAVPYSNISKVYSQADIVIDMMHGSLDKSALEACACGVPVIAANENFRGTFSKYADTLIAYSPSPEAIVEKIENLIAMGIEGRRQIGAYLREQVIEQHSLDSLMGKIIAEFERLVKKQT